jgi:hypothetical protein
MNERLLDVLLGLATPLLLAAPKKKTATKKAAPKKKTAAKKPVAKKKAAPRRRSGTATKPVVPEPMPQPIDVPPVPEPTGVPPMTPGAGGS